MGKKLKVVGAKIPPSLYKQIKTRVNSSKYMNVSDFVRQAIREKLNTEE